MALQKRLLKDFVGFLFDNKLKYYAYLCINLSNIFTTGGGELKTKQQIMTEHLNGLPNSKQNSLVV